MSTPKAIRNTLILKTLTAEAMTTSGLHIPDLAQRKQDNRAEVVSIGPDCTAAVKVGDIVVYARGSADRMDVDGHVVGAGGDDAGVLYLRVSELNLEAVIELDKPLAVAA